MSNSEDNSPPPTTFKEAFSVLQRHAETLRRQQEPNIDELVNIVTESVRAYRICKDRIQAVEQALERTLGEAQEDSRTAAAPERPEAHGIPAEIAEGNEAAHSNESAPEAARSGDDFDDDIPF